ncbi:MAG: hypothetical protein ACQCN3_02765 [Candidatus Bathyarchaeia archaeon]|jgi:hypothetical protein
MNKKITIQDALDMLVLHKMAQKVLTEKGEVGYELTDATVEMLKDNIYDVYQKNPTARIYKNSGLNFDFFRDGFCV